MLKLNTKDILADEHGKSLFVKASPIENFLLTTYQGKVYYHYFRYDILQKNNQPLQINGEDFSYQSIGFTAYNSNHTKLWIANEKGVYEFNVLATGISFEKQVHTFAKNVEIQGITIDAKGSKLFIHTKNVLEQFGIVNQELIYQNSHLFENNTAMEVSADGKTLYYLKNSELYSLNLETKQNLFVKYYGFEQYNIQIRRGKNDKIYVIYNSTEIKSYLDEVTENNVKTILLSNSVTNGGIPQTVYSEKKICTESYYIPICNYFVGKKVYELKDHLGNVRVVLSDKRGANAQSWTDYYAFGMPKVGRNGGNYRFGFQNQEQDPETGFINYKYRMHDARLGRFFAVDPLSDKYPHWSPYSFSGNQVIHTAELEGLEPVKDANEYGKMLEEQDRTASRTYHTAIEYTYDAKKDNNLQGEITGYKILHQEVTTVHDGKGTNTYQISARYATDWSAWNRKGYDFESTTTIADNPDDALNTSHSLANQKLGNTWERQMNIAGQAMFIGVGMSVTNTNSYTFPTIPIGKISLTGWKGFYIGNRQFTVGYTRQMGMGISYRKTQNLITVARDLHTVQGKLKYHYHLSQPGLWNPGRRGHLNPQILKQHGFNINDLKVGLNPNIKYKISPLYRALEASRY